MAEVRQQIAGSQDVPLQQGAAPNYALLVNVAPGIALAVDVTDRAGRLIGIVYGENAQLQQLTPADGVAPNESLEVTGFNMVYDAVADDWNRLREGAVIGQALVDLADRAARLVGIVYGEAAQLQQSAPADAHANPDDALEVGSFPHVYDPVAGDWNMWIEGANAGVPQVEDTGLNTNPRRYEKDNGFYSAPTTVGVGATALYTIATTPVRTAGEEVTIYSLHIFNDTGAAGTIWLEIGGVVVTVEYQIADDDTVCVDFPAGLTLGDNDINVNGTADIVVQISGTEA